LESTLDAPDGLDGDPTELGQKGGARNPDRIGGARQADR
jgi:hypothetical protein